MEKPIAKKTVFRLSFVGFDMLITGSGVFFPCREMYKVLQGAGVRVEEVLVHLSPTERKLLWDINPWEEANYSQLGFGHC